MASGGSGSLPAPLENVLAEGKVTIEGESGHDVADPERATSPQQASAEKVEKHRVDGHLPYRLWCKQCILRRGVGTLRTTTGSETLVPSIGMYYFFMTKGGIKRRDELAAEFGDDSD